MHLLNKGLIGILSTRKTANAGQCLTNYVKRLGIGNKQKNNYLLNNFLPLWIAFFIVSLTFCLSLIFTFGSCLLKIASTFALSAFKGSPIFLPCLQFQGLHKSSVHQTKESAFPQNQGLQACAMLF